MSFAIWDYGHYKWSTSIFRDSEVSNLQQVIFSVCSAPCSSPLISTWTRANTLSNSSLKLCIHVLLQRQYVTASHRSFQTEDVSYLLFNRGRCTRMSPKDGESVKIVDIFSSVNEGDQHDGMTEHESFSLLATDDFDSLSPPRPQRLNPANRLWVDQRTLHFLICPFSKDLH